MQSQPANNVESAGMVTILCFRSQRNKAFLRYFYQVWLKKAQCGAWLQIHFSYFIIFTYIEQFLMMTGEYIITEF